MKRPGVPSAARVAGVFRPTPKAGGKAPHSNGAAEVPAAAADECQLLVHLEEPGPRGITGGGGEAHIKDFWQRFASMSSLREFIEGLPEECATTPGSGRGFTADVPHATGKGKGKGLGEGTGGGTVAPGPQGRKRKGKAGEDFEALSEAAIVEITTQLMAPDNTGRVWIEDWNARFLPVLGTLKSFMECHPDRFAVIPRGDRAYLVALADDEAAIAQRSGGKGLPKASECKGGLKGDGCKGFDGCRAKGGKNMPTLPSSDRILGGDPASSAIHEITSQLQRRKDGRVYIDDWKEQYHPVLGPMKEFMESLPERFIVIPGEGKKYTVQLVDASVYKRPRNDGTNGDLDPKRPRPLKGLGGSLADKIDSNGFGT